MARSGGAPVRASLGQIGPEKAENRPIRALGTNPAAEWNLLRGERINPLRSRFDVLRVGFGRRFGIKVTRLWAIRGGFTAAVRRW